MFNTTPVIWLADGNREIREENLASFAKMRCVVTSFKRGLDAVVRLQNATPHLIAVSRVLKDGCGINLAMQLRTMKYKGMIVLLSTEEDYRCRSAIAKGIINLRMGLRIDPVVVTTILTGKQVVHTPGSLQRNTTMVSLWSRLTSVGR